MTALFVPVALERARALRDGEDLGALPAYAAGRELREAHGLGESDDEEAGFVALGYAGLAALLDDAGPRVVLAAEAGTAQVRPLGGDFGEVEVVGLRWNQVTALFSDEPEADVDLAEARRLSAGRTLADLADDDALVGLVDRWDLLWFAPEELDAVRVP